MKKALFFKHKPPKEWEAENYTLHLRLRKDERTLDMRDKNTREYVYQISQTRFYDFMQRVANFLGCPHDKSIMMGSMSWKHYLNPIKQIKYRLTGIWYL